jgi:MoxR-like ATPase
VITADKVIKVRRTVEDLYVDEKIKNYILDLVLATREPEKYRLGHLKNLIQFGASPRASIALLKASRAYAFLRGRGYVTPEDVKTVGPDVLRHRILLTYEAEAEEKNQEDVLRHLFDGIEVP